MVLRRQQFIQSRWRIMTHMRGSNWMHSFILKMPSKERGIQHINSSPITVSNAISMTGVGCPTEGATGGIGVG